jgi:anti-anti-sigma factor
MALVIKIDPQPTLVSLVLEGELDTKSAPQLLEELTKIALAELEELRIHASELSFMSSAGLRALVFAKQKMPHTSRLLLIGASDSVREVISRTGLESAVTLLDSIDDTP